MSKNWLKPDFVRAMLAGHSTLGLTFAALIYIVCVSGALSMFLPELGQWEQLKVGNTANIAPEAIGQAIDKTLALSGPKKLMVLAVAPPAEFLPRTSVTAVGDSLMDRGNIKSWYVNPDGSLVPVHKPFTEFVEFLHKSLTGTGLPGRLIGYPIVGISGIGLLALLITGFLSHPRIFRDAFSLRWGGSKRLQEADVHNRLSVWGAPFGIMITLTGAYASFFLSLLMPLVAYSLYGGNMKPFDLTRLTDMIPGAAQVRQTSGSVAEISPLVVAALKSVRNDPKLLAEPVAIFVLGPGTPKQTVAVISAVKNSVIVGDSYAFGPKGEIIARAGIADGNVGRQMYMIGFGLHFGRFGGLATKILYFVLGAGLSAVVATGVNIWVVRRRDKGAAVPGWERVWCTTVWGMLLAITIAGVASLAAGAPPSPVFWFSYLALFILPALIRDARRLSLILRGSLAAGLAAIVVAHVGVNGAAAFAPLPLIVNGCFLFAAAMMLLWCLAPGRPSAASVADRRDDPPVIEPAPAE